MGGDVPDGWVIWIGLELRVLRGLLARRSLRTALATSLIAGGLVATTVFQPARAETTQEFSHTGDVQTFTVPEAVIKLQVVAEGGNGYNAFDLEDNALGAQVVATLPVAPGQQFDLYVGGAATGTEGGFNGGGGVDVEGFSGGGGGATDIRPSGGALDSRLIVAGGGGGARSTDQGLGGSGGTPNGVAGDGSVNAECIYGGGQGATTEAGGAGGQLSGTCGEGWAAGDPGTFGVGGDGGSEYGAGGGGGFYGGGGSAGFISGAGAGGGGGSSYVDASATGAAYELKSGTDQQAGKLTLIYSEAFVVTFDANGGSGSMQEQLADSSTALTANAFARAGYTFAGWNTSADGLGAGYANEAQYPFAVSATLYAQWVEAPDPGAGPQQVAPTNVEPITVKIKQRKSTKKKVVIRWDRPTTAESFDLRLTNKRGKKYKSWKPLSRTKFVKRMTNGKYRVQIRAVNDAGAGPASTKKFRIR